MRSLPRWALVASIAVTLAGPTVSAAPPQDGPALPSPLPLEALRSAVRARSPEVIERQRAADAADLRPAMAGWPEDPMLSLEWWQQPVDLSTVPLMATLRQPLPLGRTLALRRAVEQGEARLVRDDAERAVRRVLAEAERAYFDLALAEGSLGVNERVTAVLRHLVDVTGAQYRAGRAPQADVFKAQAELLVAENDRYDIERARDEAIARLNTLLDRPADAPLGPTATEPTLIALPPAAALLETALARRPDLRRYHDQVAAAEARLRLAGRDRRPELAAWAGFMLNLRGTDTFTVGLSSTLPVFSSGRARAGERAERAAIESAKATLVAGRRQAELELRLVELRLATAARHVRLHHDQLVPLADAALASAEASYVAGRSPLIAVLDATRTVRDHHLDHLRFLVDYRQRLADLEEALGTDLAGVARP